MAYINSTFIYKYYTCGTADRVTRGCDKIAIYRYVHIKSQGIRLT